ncbi:MAG: PrsW family glutamic-type intramembrane protease [Bacteroidetes bacterium]|nr:PrsW family glutamic-type intramembrane protease [Bacteroidota bacterium]
MRPIAYITLAFAPVVALAMYLYLGRKYGKAFQKVLIRSFLAGVLGVSVLAAAKILSSLLGLNDLRSLKRLIFYSFITIGFATELGKFILYRFYIIPKKAVDKPIHGITMSVMTALGFCTIALPGFMLDLFHTQALYPYTLYTFVFVPANIMFAVVMGFFVGMGKFIKTYFMFTLTGLFGAAFFQGLFTFTLMTSDFKLLSLFAFGSTVIVFILGIKAAVTEPEID